MQRFILWNSARLIGALLMGSALNVACFAQLDILVTPTVTEMTDGMFRYSYTVDNLPVSTVGMNSFLLDVGEKAEISDLTAPDGWESSFDSSVPDFEVAWVTDPESDEFDITPGGFGVFSLVSNLEPAPVDFFALNLTDPDPLDPKWDGDAAGRVTGPSVFVEPEADCNGDGVVDIMDANCTPDDLLDDFLASLDPTTIRGDADGDGEVQFTDLVTLSTNFGSPGEYTDADFDKDEVVQFGDLVILSTEFGYPGAAPAVEAVPEPAAVIGVLIGAICLLPVIRRRER